MLTRRLHPSSLTVWLRLLKEDVRTGGECEQAPGGGPPPAGLASGSLTSSLSLRSLPQQPPEAARLCSSTPPTTRTLSSWWVPWRQRCASCLYAWPWTCGAVVN